VLLSFGRSNNQFDVVADNESTRCPQRMIMRPLHDAYWAINAKIRVAERFSQMFSLTISTEGMQAHKELFAQVF
jgi:hypothetical protein